MIANAEKYASVDKEKREKVNLKTKAYNLIDEYERLTSDTTAFSDGLQTKVTELNSDVTKLKELVTNELSDIQVDEVNNITSEIEQVISQITSENSSDTSSSDTSET